MSGGFFKHPKASATGLVFSQVLTVAATTLDTGANAIPSGGNVLLAYADLRTDEAAVQSTVGLTVNGDSGTNYDSNRIEVQNASVSGATGAGAASVILVAAAASTSAGVATPMRIVMPTYSGSTFFKNGLIDLGIPDETAANMVWFARQFQWRGTSAVSRLTLSIVSGSGQKFLAGSALYVYVV